MTNDLQLADAAHENYTYIVSLRNQIKKYFWVLIQQLKECREKKYWQTLGYETWPSYLAQPEIDLAAHTVDNYISTLNTLLIRKVVLPEGIDISKVAIIAPHLTPENAEELIEQAKTLSRSDLTAYITKKEIVKKCITCPKCGYEW